MQDAVVILGHYSLLIALLASAWATIASLAGAAIGSRGLQISAERSLIASAGVLGLSTLCLVQSFLANDFRLDYVYHYSSSSQALSYKIGELRIREMRARAETELGSSFNLREFHDEIIGHGSLPIAVLESIVDDWIAERRG